MRLSNLFGETQRELPAGVDTESHRLLLRAGYVRQLGSGIFSYLPLAQRSLRKVEAILREEMDRIGGQEICMPVVHPAEIWKRSGRWDTVGPEMVRLRDRRGRDLVLAMTHEEVVAELARGEVRSYRQLPILVYQIQTKFRDEPRARGGLIRVREFVMKDAYSLDRDVAGLERQYAANYHAYLRIGQRVGVPLVAVQSDVGMMGGRLAHEFMYVTPVGEDTLVLCDACGYAANREVADFAYPEPEGGTEGPLEALHTPEASTIEALARFLEIPASRTAKTLVFQGVFAVGAGREERTVVVLVRGDMTVNPVRVQAVCGARELRVANDEELRAVGLVPGFASPIGIEDARVVVVVDELVAAAPGFVTGANREGWHQSNARVGRDLRADHVARVAAAAEGAPCASCGAALRLGRGIEVGNIFQLGTRYSDALDARFADATGELHAIVMGSYGIGVGRMLACAAEEHHDERGLAWPVSIAPLHVALVPLGRDGEAARVAEDLHRELEAAGVETLLEDRDLAPGEKLAEADLRGLPLRVIVSARSLKQGGVEVKERRAAEGAIEPLEGLVARLAERLRAMEQGMHDGLEDLPRLGSLRPPAAG